MNGRLEIGEVRRWLEADDAEPELFRLEGATAAGISTRCPDKPTSNEDAAVVLALPGGEMVMAVADGCGGLASGELAARLTIDAVVSAVNSLDSQGSVRAAILDGIEAANREVIALGTGSATTLVVAHIAEGLVRTFHVGDSQAMLIGGRGKLKLLTKAHSPVGYALESGIIDEREALVHEDRHLVSNLVGVEEMHVEVGPSVMLAARDMLLLASDGLWDNLLLEEVIAATQHGPALHVATRLAAAAWERMHDEGSNVSSKPDDLTLIAYSRR